MPGTQVRLQACRRQPCVLFTLLSLCLLYSALLESALADEPGTDPNASIWRVALPELGAPFVVRDPEVSGLYAQWWLRLGALAGKTVQFHLCEPSQCFETLANDQVDFVGPSYWPAGIRQPYTRPVACTQVLGLARALPTHRDARAITGKRVVLTANEDSSATLRWQPGELQRMTTAKAGAALEAGTVDVVVHHSTNGPRVKTASTAFPLWSHWLFVFGPEASAIDPLIDELSSSTRPLERAWLPLDTDSRFLKARERLNGSPTQFELLADSPTIRLGASPWEPLTIATSSGYDGLALRLVTYHYQRAGLTPIFEGTNNWLQVAAAAKRGDYDGLGYVVAPPAPGRAGNLRFSNTFMDLPLVALIRTDAPDWQSVEDLAGLRVALHSRYAETRDHSDILRIAGDDSRQALSLLQRGSIDAWIEYLPIAEHYVEQAGAGDVKVAFRIGGPMELRTALGPEHAPLIPLIDQSIERQSTAAIDRIVTQWSKQQTTSAMDDAQRWLPVVVGAATFGVALLLALLVSDRQKATAQANRLHRRLLASGVGSTSLKVPWTNVQLNGRTAHMLGLPDQLTTQPLAEHCSSFDDGVALSQAFRRLLEQASDEETLELRSVNQPERLFAYTLTREANASRLSGTIRDITARQAQEAREALLQREVLELQKLDAVGQLAAGIAHDFNNILSVSLGHSDLALNKLPHHHPAYGDLERVVSANLQARDLVSQIVDFSRRHQEEFQVLSLSKVVQETLDLLRAGTPATVTVHADVPATPVWIYGEKSKMSQVIMNLYTNALDALQGQGRVTVTLTEPTAGDGTVTLTVEDDGPGIDPAQRSKVFEPFYTTKTVGTRSGLGLSIAHGIVRAHAGAIDIDDTISGARFVVTLPAAAKDNVAVLPRVDTHRVSVEGLTVWLIDDEPGVRKVLAAQLRQECTQVREFAHPTSLLEALASSTRIDAIITDLSMPEMDGVQLCGAIKAIRPNLPVILVTGYSDHVVGASREAFSTILRKPIRTQALLDALQNAEH